jgi:hypothetical protein
MRHHALKIITLFIAVLGISQLAAADYATIKTSAGTIVIELDNAKAPISVANFEQYAKEGFYDGTVFHRIMPAASTFMVSIRERCTRSPALSRASKTNGRTA